MGEATPPPGAGGSRPWEVPSFPRGKVTAGRSRFARVAAGNGVRRGGSLPCRWRLGVLIGGGGAAYMSGCRGQKARGKSTTDNTAGPRALARGSLHGGHGETLVQPYTRVSLSLAAYMWSPRPLAEGGRWLTPAGSLISRWNMAKRWLLLWLLLFGLLCFVGFALLCWLRVSGSVASLDVCWLRNASVLCAI